MKEHQSATPASLGENFLTENQLLTRLPICRKTLFNYVEAGKIPVVQIARRKLYHWGNVQAALLRMERNGGNVE
jgi:predicted site-specific integrase-resolvase